MNEIWKDIPGYEGKYQASSLGRIKSLNYKMSGKEGIMSHNFKNDGYLEVCLRNNGKAKTICVHRLVWMAFYGMIPDGMEVNHKNEDKTDNCIFNLNLLTHRQNCIWGTRIKRLSENLKGVLKNRKDTSKWVIQLSKDNEILHFYPSAKEAGRATGLSNANISSCCHGRFRTSGGFIWKFAE